MLKPPSELVDEYLRTQDLLNDVDSPKEDDLTTEGNGHLAPESGNSAEDLRPGFFLNTQELSGSATPFSMAKVDPMDDKVEVEREDVLHDGAEEDEEDEDRDHNNINTHLQISWDDVFAEPEDVRSAGFSWRCSRGCFRGTRSCCYILLTALFAPCLAFFAAINFACLAFAHIWCLTPCLRSWKVNCSFQRTCCRVFCQACCGPCYETIGFALSKVRIRYQRLTDNSEDRDIMLV